MSFRLLTTRLFKHGRYFLQCYCKRDIYTNILEHGKNRTLAVSLPKTGEQHGKQILRSHNSGIFRLGQHARKLFIDNILNRVTTNYSTELRTQAVKKLFYGDSAPFFALVGVSLASGAGVLTKEDELEGVCWEIREAANRIQRLWNSEDVSDCIDENFNIDQLDVGPPIAKGCAAVVYAAALKNKGQQKNPKNIDFPLSFNDGIQAELMAPIQNMSRFVHNFGGNIDHLPSINQGVSMESILRAVPTTKLNAFQLPTSKEEFAYLHRNSVNENQAWGLSNEADQLDLLKIDTSICRYPLALKMMFNYDIKSNALSIIRAMYKETLPARRRLTSKETTEWEKLLEDQSVALPAHPNIVLMFGYFCGEVQNFRDGHILYPIAQPPRINPHGYGRNMSLYLLMKRYDCSLSEYLRSGEVLSLRTKILMFAQLLEAVTHVNRHGIAHRDLKSDNILIELNDGGTPPLLVLSDFGCCIADKIHGLQIPFTSHDIDKGGNAALMAPEIMKKTPGAFAALNYSKSDLWACGAIAYEIFEQINPFYANNNTNELGNAAKALQNTDYEETDLPQLSESYPYIVRQLIYNILDRNPNRRLSPDIAANVMQLYLWAPSSWLKSGGMPTSPEILQWLLSLTTKIMYERKHGNCLHTDEFNFKMERRTYVEYVLICSFLARARLRRIRGALSWIQTIV